MIYINNQAAKIRRIFVTNKLLPFFFDWNKKTAKVVLFCGPGGSRTLVRTRKPYAFYMLIPAFIFVMQQDPDHQLHPYLLKLHLAVGAPDRLFPIFLHRLILRFGTRSLERCLVLSPCKRIKPVIYCTSIRQRERTVFRQLIVRPERLWSLQPSLRMLTYHLVLPSNPVKPK